MSGRKPLPACYPGTRLAVLPPSSKRLNRAQLIAEAKMMRAQAHHPRNTPQIAANFYLSARHLLRAARKAAK